MKIVPDRPNLVCILPAMQRRQYVAWPEAGLVDGNSGKGK